jgi:hypothetical protein
MSTSRITPPPKGGCKAEHQLAEEIEVPGNRGERPLEGEHEGAGEICAAHQRVRGRPTATGAGGSFGFFVLHASLPQGSGVFQPRWPIYARGGESFSDAPCR